MDISEIQKYFDQLDNSLNKLSPEFGDRKIKEDFPNYRHIGPYVDPRREDVREFFKNTVDNNLSGYSFDPLLSFSIKQVKYSKEVLHPDCRCFRRINSKQRPIKTCSHRDRILFGAWNLYLSTNYKRWLEQNNLINSVSAYIQNTGKNNAHFAKQAFDYLQGKKEYSAVALDIRSFFDNVPHTHLLSNLKSLLSCDGYLDEVDFKMFKATSEYTYINSEEIQPIISKLETAPGMLFNRRNRNWNKLRASSLLHKNDSKGIPQGLACSGVLANIVMMDFDSSMNKTAGKDSIYIRYADDIFIASPNKDILNSLHNNCTKELKKLDLPIAEDKTERFHFSPSINQQPRISYLGLECFGNEVGVRMNGVNKYYERAYKFIFSYVITCRKRGKKPSRKKIRAIFSHSGTNNYYSYLRRASKVFENDIRYKPRGIKGILKKHMEWIDETFNKALHSKLPSGQYIVRQHKCCCPLKRDG